MFGIAGIVGGGGGRALFLNLDDDEEEGDDERVGDNGVEVVGDSGVVLVAVVIGTMFGVESSRLNRN